MDKTLLKGLQVLDYVVRANRNVRIIEVAAELDLTKSNAYRALKTLESAGYIRQDPSTKDFTPSLLLWELGALVVERFDLRGRANETLHWLSAQCRETVHLAVRDGTEVVFIDKIDSLEPVAAYSRLGGRAPAAAGATGKALLSQLPRPELDRVLVNLTKYTDNTITDPERLKAELARARELDYAINRGEIREGVWGLGSVIRYPNGTPAAAVGISGPQFRIDKDGRCAELAELVKTAAQRISAALR
ncbi:MAG: IclR family transcriptional regulator [Phenylobacterium sp.]|uniref:IclR family transcriptional regulator n=1 Tax=Phenylobacterium sp. TaxID=1871053 RepID=UPI0027328759|nr:IclR family transcriptional regulator [Phenylobacterium sp.]MDP3747672.1 IclR family transcriptional regulator [Phenylobacterium sp.]